jgi:YD repeat-containing protein
MKIHHKLRVVLVLGIGLTPIASGREINAKVARDLVREALIVLGQIAPSVSIVPFRYDYAPEFLSFEALWPSPGGSTLIGYFGVNASHHVTKRTDAKGEETRYSYDSYGRLTQVQHWAGSPLAELASQRVTYSYDSNPLNGSYSQNAWGRLTAVQFQDESSGTPFSYMYSYNQAGRVTAQHMDYSGGALGFDAAYNRDNEGRMTWINYGPQYTLSYDANGRLGGMSGSDLTMAASYGPFAIPPSGAQLASRVGRRRIGGPQIPSHAPSREPRASAPAWRAASLREAA